MLRLSIFQGKKYQTWLLTAALWAVRLHSGSATESLSHEHL